MVTVGVLRGPDGRHRAERVHGGRVGALEHDALGRQAVDLRRRLARVAVGPERARAARVQDDEQDVRAGQALAQRLGPRVLLLRDRRGLERLAAAHAQHSRRHEPAPGEARPVGDADREPEPHDVARPPGRRTTCSAAAAERASSVWLQSSRSPPDSSSSVTRNDAAPAAARAGASSSGVKRSSAPGGSRIANRIIAGPTRVSDGTPLTSASVRNGRGASRPRRSSSDASEAEPVARL